VQQAPEGLIARSSAIAWPDLVSGHAGSVATNSGRLRYGDVMSRFQPKNPDNRAIATATFERQQAMRTLGISILRLEPGEVDLAMTYSAQFTQQNGFVHAGIITAGLDNACGIAAFSLTPAGSDILTVEFKTNLLAPAKGERFVFRAHVVKPGRTLTVCEARAFAQSGDAETLIATMTGTLMALTPWG
jgi:uncharacterized protein (TIGR00369 family)